MFPIFDTISHFIRSGFAVGFAAFWGWSSVWLNGARLDDLRLMGLAGVLVAVALAGAAISAGLYTLILFLRDGGKAKVDAKKAVARREPVSDFDPDAIIARHIAAKRLSAPRMRPATHRPLGATNSFGRKVAQA